MRWFVGWWLVLVGCYRPDVEPACTVRCTGANAPCPQGSTCNAVAGRCEPAGGCATVDDAGVHDAPPVPEGCYGAGLVQICPEPSAIEASRMVSAYIDTDQIAPSHCTLTYDLNGQRLCVVVAHEIQIGGISGAFGSVPVVFVATRALQIAGVFDVASGPTLPRGAGSSGARCMPTAAGIADADGGGGGPGGSFQGRGGDGGASATSIIAASSDPLELGFQGGCDGGLGGLDGSAAGAGGGAVYFIAGGSISIASAAAINASGGPAGASTTDRGGGGGGGAGGFIGFDAPNIMIAGSPPIFALGGGGSPGGAMLGGNIPDGPLAPAEASGGGGFGGEGAGAQPGARDGNAGGSVPGAPGGGGGGGVGYIGVHGTLTGAPRFDPAPTPMN